jgi:hypothetical protein
MSETVRIFVAGIITIGVITALFLPGRTTVQAIGATGTATSGVLNTAIKG